jgi:hypothetical protein
MIFAAVDVMPLIIVVKRLADDVATLVSIIVDVATFPFTVDVRVFPERARALFVDDATRSLRFIVVAIPFTVDVRSVPVTSSPFEDTTEDVAVTPLIVVVKVLPERV